MSYGISVTIEGVGCLEQKWTSLSRHEVKSRAGKAFHGPNVKSVCVYDNSGEVQLYLKKTPNGVVRECLR
jgi:hypothetical protein